MAIPKGDIAELTALPVREHDPLDIIAEQNTNRLQHLVPVRTERMAESPFAYYRGTAGPMAADLATRAHSGVTPLICGDAHVSNFGFYASPERRLLFDLNDFDEAGVGPWEWDLKRLVTSMVLAASDRGWSESTGYELAQKTSKFYRQALLRLNQMSNLDRFYASVDTAVLEEELKSKSKNLGLVTDKARKRTSAQALKKLTVEDAAGRRLIKEQPPLTQRLEGSDAEVADLLERYAASASPEIRYLLRNFTQRDFVLRVVGVGSVGTRCFITLLEDQTGAPLFLQIKEAQPTVLATYGGIEQFSPWLGNGAGEMGNGYRVIASQRILQAQSDVFLGFVEGFETATGSFDFYVRQFRDMKGSVDLSVLSKKEMRHLARTSATLLARAHSQSPVTDDIAVFCEAGAAFDTAMADFARGYAALCTEDYLRFSNLA